MRPTSNVHFDLTDGLSWESVSAESLLSRLRRGNDKPSQLVFILDGELDEKAYDLIRSLIEMCAAQEVRSTIVCFRLSCLREVGVSLPAGDSLKYAEDYLASAELDDIDDKAYEWLRGWYRLGCLSKYKPCLYYRGIPLGSLVEYELSTELPQFLKKVKTIMTILTQEKADMVLLFTRDAQLEEVTQFVGKQMNCPVVKLSLPRVSIAHSSQSIIHLAAYAGRLFDNLLFLWDYMTLKLLPRGPRREVILVELSSRLYSLFDALTKKLQKRVLMLGLEGGTLGRLSYLRQKRVYRVLYHFSTASTVRVRKARRETARVWHEVQNDLDFRSFFDFAGLNLWPVIEHKLNFVFKTLIPRRIQLLEATYQGLAFYQPSLVILNADTAPHQRAICAAAKQLGIPTLYIHHGIVVGARGHDIIFADKVAVWGKSHIEWYDNLGNDSHKVAVTGTPLFDKLYSRLQATEVRNNKAKEKICQELHLDARKEIITFATGAAHKVNFFTALRCEDESEVTFRAVIEAMKEFPEKQLVVKLHPMESGEVYYRVLKEMNWVQERTRVVKEIDLHDLIDASELVTTAPSTVALESIILGKPTIMVHFGLKGENPVYMRFPTLNLLRKEELIPTMRSVFGAPEVKQKLVREAAKFLSSEGEYVVDGKSTERIINLINSILGEQEK